MNGEEYKYHKIKLTCGGATGLYYYEERAKANEIIECLDTMEIEKEAVVVMDAVRRKDPKYAFSVSTGWRTVNRAKDDKPWRCIDFDVWYDGEKLGEYDGWDNNHQVKSRLTTKELRSTDWKRTKSMRTATKNILKYIKPIAMRERFDTLQRLTANAINAALNNVRYMAATAQTYAPSAKTSPCSRLFDVIMTEHKSTAKNIFKRMPEYESKVEQMIEDYDSFISITEMQKQAQDGKGVLVIKYGNDIYMDNVFGRHSNMQTLQHKDLCDETKTHLAMLSISNPDTLITDVGVKINDTQFYLQQAKEMQDAR
jgi:hypothetical protein